MPEVADDVGDWERHLCSPVTGRKIICSFELLAGMTRLVASLRRWGAERPLLIAEGRGAGPIPSEDEAEIVAVEPPRFESLTDQVRARMRPADRLTPQVVASVEAYDSDKQAAWWTSPIGPNTALLDRPVLGGRPPQHIALEDKMIVDDLLDAVGAATSGAVVVPARDDDLLAASDAVRVAAAVDSVVWAGDARDGINGGGDFVRWVRNRRQAQAAADFFAAHCDKVRVAPFLEGVPCSVHGIVLPDGVVVLRPMELATLRDPDNGRFLYAGMGTSWEPPPADAAAMRQLARDMGEHLRQLVGYRGGFGLDGVLTAAGFRVTELNPRFSGGLTRLGRAAPAAHLELVHINALLGRAVGRPAEQIEADALALLDDNRFVDVMGVSTAVTATESVEVRVAVGQPLAGLGSSSGTRSRGSSTNRADGLTSAAEPLRLEAAADDAQLVGTVLCGPSPLGTFVRLVAAPDVLRVGDRAAPLGVLLLDFADRTWGTGFGPVRMAAAVRR